MIVSEQTFAMMRLARNASSALSSTNKIYDFDIGFSVVSWADEAEMRLTALPKSPNRFAGDIKLASLAKGKTIRQLGRLQSL